MAYLRLGAGRHPDDRVLTELFGELSMESEHLRRLWADHLVGENTYGVKRLIHPVVGEPNPAYETPALPGDGGLTVVVCTAQPGSPTAERLAVLAGRHAGALPARAGQG